MNNDLSNITFCKRINKLILGFDMVKNAMEEKSIFLVVLANDISEKTEKEIIFLCEKNGIKHKKTNISMTEFDYVIGKRVGILGVADENFAKKISDTNDK